VKLTIETVGAACAAIGIMASAAAAIAVFRNLLIAATPSLALAPSEHRRDTQPQTHVQNSYQFFDFVSFFSDSRGLIFSFHSLKFTKCKVFRQFSWLIR
jgi:hypothetical protein